MILLLVDLIAKTTSASFRERTRVIDSLQKYSLKMCLSPKEWLRISCAPHKKPSGHCLWWWWPSFRGSHEPSVDQEEEQEPGSKPASLTLEAKALSEGSWLHHAQHLIEERDMLLRSGVYKNEDRIIEDLNRRIAEIVSRKDWQFICLLCSVCQRIFQWTRVFVQVTSCPRKELAKILWNFASLLRGFYYNFSI